MPKLEAGTFFQTPRTLIGLPSRQQAVLSCLCDYADAKGKCFPGVDTIAAYCVIARKTVIKAIKELELNKRIEAKRTYDRELKKRKSIYTVFSLEECVERGGVIMDKNDLKIALTSKGVIGSEYCVIRSGVLCKMCTVRKNSEEETKNEKQSNTLAAASVKRIVNLLFSSTTLKEVESLITAKIPSDSSRSWKQFLCAAFGHFKTVELIWERSRQLIDLHAISPQGENTPLLRGSLNYLDKALRDGVSFEKIKVIVKENGWEEFKYRYSNDALNEYE